MIRTFFYISALLIFSVCFFSSCKDPEKEKVSTNPSKTADSIGLPALQQKQLNEINYKFIPVYNLTPWKGKVVSVANWIDAKGKNVIIISGSKSNDWRNESPEMKNFAKDGDDCELAQLFAYHYIFNDSLNKWNANWTLNDFEFSCSDTHLQFFPGSLRVSDIDTNGIAESCFAYYESYNIVDLMYRIKLILHVNSIKLKAFGTIGKYKDHLKDYDGKKSLAPDYSATFEEFDPNYRKYAEKMWNRYSHERDSLDELFLKESGLKDN